MTVFLESQGSRVAKAITKLFVSLKGDKDTWSDIATKEYDANFKAYYALLLLWIQTRPHDRIDLGGTVKTNYMIY